MRAHFLANRIPWFGSHSGYEQLPAHVGAAGIEPHLYTSRPGLISRALGKMVSTARGHGRISQSDAAARFRFEWGLRRLPEAIGHLLYGEAHLPFWKDAPEPVRRRSVLTLHQPSSQWLDSSKTEALAACPHVIVLWQRELDWFRARLPRGTVHFIPHGADIDFFSPAEKAPDPAAPLRLLYAGVHLRNTAMLGRIIRALDKRHGNLQFDLLVPPDRRSEPALLELRDHPRVQWHAGLSDLQLRELYRSAHLLLLPMNDSGANTAVIEALACGLPIVTTDVGGIRDYGGGTVFPVVENNDDEGMLAVIENYLAQPGRRDEVAARARAFAETELAWPLIARRHAELYRKVAA
jgi:glycosyltransferase involved in cell wall biosynthesis